MTTLAVAAGLTDGLELEAVVVNTAWVHPALVVRQFAQLAQLIGGERVTAGLGAGWSPEEFDAIGLRMPPFSRRIERLRETMAMTRALFDDGVVSLDGEQIVARDLPLSPRPAVPPRLLVGGGSDRVLEMAGAYADILDLHGHPARGTLVGATMQQALRGDALRRALTTVRDLEDRIGLVHAACRAAGRPIDAVGVSGPIFFTAYDDVAEAQRQLCRRWAQIPEQSLSDSPYLLFGEPARMADALRERHERYGLDRITLLTEDGGRRARDLAQRGTPNRCCKVFMPRSHASVSAARRW